MHGPKGSDDEEACEGDDGAGDRVNVDNGWLNSNQSSGVCGDQPEMESN